MIVVAELVAVLVPAVFVATKRTLMYWPRSALTKRYVEEVAPLIAMYVPAEVVARNHW